MRHFVTCIWNKLSLVSFYRQNTAYDFYQAWNSVKKNNTKEYADLLRQLETKRLAKGKLVRWGRERERQSKGRDGTGREKKRKGKILSVCQERKMKRKGKGTGTGRNRETGRDATGRYRKGRVRIENGKEEVKVVNERKVRVEKRRK